MLLIKIILIVLLTLVFYQDRKDRQIHWFLLPLIAICMSLLHYKMVQPEQFFTSAILNTMFIITFIGLLFCCVKYILKYKWSKAIGLGDVLMFITLISSFATLSFLIIFICSLFFAMLMHLTLNRFQKQITIPLAGYMSLFFGLTYIGYWSGLINSVYTY